MSSYHVGHRIKELRKLAGMTQHHLASQVGIHSKYLSLLECGKKIPSLPVLEKMAHILNVPVNSFFKNAENDFTDKTLMSKLQEGVRKAASDPNILELTCVLTRLVENNRESIDPTILDLARVIKRLLESSQKETGLSETHSNSSDERQ